MIKPKEKPIIFSTPLIPAIQNLKPDVWPPEPIDPSRPWKYMTRRIMKPQPPEGYFIGPCGYSGSGWSLWEKGRHGKPDGCTCTPVKCPYPPGTRLYVKETWAPFYWTEDYISVCYAADGIDKETAGQRRVLIKNPGIPESAVRIDGGLYNIKKWRSPRFMPRAAARLFLEVKNVRVERIDEASEADALAEGVDTINKFIIPWNKLNGKKGFLWSSRCWVWVVEFQRVSEL